MKLHFFDVPVSHPEASAAELNRFLGSHRVLTVDRHFVNDGPRSRWAICVTYVVDAPNTADVGHTKRARVDYRQVLPEAQFKVFAALRVLRKELAERENVPVYTVFSNEQLAEMVTRPVRTLPELEALPGVGPARRDTYGAAFLARLDALMGAS